jgi:hypothetical protein
MVREASTDVHLSICVTWVGGEGQMPPPPVIFIPKNNFTLAELKRGKYRNWDASGGKWMYVH